MIAVRIPGRLRCAPLDGQSEGASANPDNPVHDFLGARLPAPPHQDNLVAPGRSRRVTVRRPFRHQPASLIE
jgi:hypothetical protein